MPIPERTQEMLRGLAGVTEEILWGADLVYKVGGKMFTVFGLVPWPEGAEETGGSFKTTAEEFDDLASRPGLHPSKYLAKHKWVSFDHWRVLPLSELEARFRTSYQLVKAALPRRTQAAIDAGTYSAKPAAKRPKSSGAAKAAAKRKVAPTKAEAAKAKAAAPARTKAAAPKAKAAAPATGRTKRTPRKTAKTGGKSGAKKKR